MACPFRPLASANALAQAKRRPFESTNTVLPMAQYVFSMNRVGKIVPPKRHILKDVSLSFFPGAKIGVLGTNGSGKSTLLKIMAGIDKEIEGEAIPMPGIRIGYLPQEPLLNPEQNVREAVEESLGEVRSAHQPRSRSGVRCRCRRWR